MKRCSTCKQEKSLTRFHKKAGHGDGFQAICKDCALIAARRSQRKNRTAKRELVLAAKAQPCVDCERCYPARIMHSDHVRGSKTAGIAVLAHTSMPVEKFKQELAKCDLRCANCHGLRHEEAGWGWTYTSTKA